MKKIALVFVMVFFLCCNFATCEEFNDIKGAQCEDAVKFLVGEKILSGYPDGTFRPQNTITRAEISTVMVKLNKIELNEKSYYNNFNDINSHWAKSYIYTLYELGYVSGYSESEFRPNNNVTYAEVATMLLNSCGYKEEVNNLKLKWPDNYIEKAKSFGLYKNLNYTDSNIPMTRGEVAIFLYNAFSSMIKEEAKVENEVLELPRFKIEDGVLDLGEDYEKYKVAYDTTEAWYIPLTRYLTENERWHLEGYDGAGKGWYPECCKIIIFDGKDEIEVRMVKFGVEVPIFDGNTLDLGANWAECFLGINSIDNLQKPIKQNYLLEELKINELELKIIYMQFGDNTFKIDYDQHNNSWIQDLVK